MLFVVLSILLASNSFALEGRPYIELSISGNKYSVPIPNDEATNEFYMLKKATLGDEIAREILLGGKEDRWFFIGDVDIVRWVHITKDDMQVKEY